MTVMREQGLSEAAIASGMAQTEKVFMGTLQDWRIELPPDQVESVKSSMTRMLKACLSIPNESLLLLQGGIAAAQARKNTGN